MQTATPPSTRKAWANAIAQPATEFPLTPLPILSGRIPQGVRYLTLASASDLIPA